MSHHPKILQEGFFAAHQLLGSKATRDDTNQALAVILESGEQETRIYHRTEHFEKIAGSEPPSDIISAIRYRAAMHHDVVYQHVDELGEYRSGFAPDVANTLGLLITRDMENNIQLVPTQDNLQEGILHIFGIETHQPLHHRDGKNELLSTLFGMVEGRTMGVADKYLLAEAVHIAGTIPFGPISCFDELQNRFKQANQKFLPAAQRFTDEEIESIMHSAVLMANRDIAGFTAPFEKFIGHTRELLVEEAPAGMDSLDDPAILWVPINKQSNFFMNVLAPKSATGEMRVFHGLNGVPSDDEVQELENKAMDNVRGLGDYLNANAAAMAIAAALDAEASGTLSQSLQHLFEASEVCLSGKRLNEQDALVHQGALRACQNKSMLSDKLAGELLAALGSEAVCNIREAAHKCGIFNSNLSLSERTNAAQNFLDGVKRELESEDISLKISEAKTNQFC